MHPIITARNTRATARRLVYQNLEIARLDRGTQLVLNVPRDRAAHTRINQWLKATGTGLRIDANADGVTLRRSGDRTKEIVRADFPAWNVAGATAHITHNLVAVPAEAERLAA